MIVAKYDNHVFALNLLKKQHASSKGGTLSRKQGRACNPADRHTNYNNFEFVKMLRLKVLFSSTRVTVY